MDGSTQDLLQNLATEGFFDSKGTFQIDLLRARSSLEQNLGLDAEDYLIFLLQAAYLWGASNIRLRSNWYSFSWEFDGVAFSREQLEALVQNNDRCSVTLPLQRLSLCLFLLSRSHFKTFCFYSCQGHQGWKLKWRRGQWTVEPHSNETEGHTNVVELCPPLRLLPLSWWLARNMLLASLPEFAGIQGRIQDSPLRWHLPWIPSPIAKEPVALAVCVKGRQRMSAQAPWPAVVVKDWAIDESYSFWFLLLEPANLRCLIYGLSYDLPQWYYGGLWLYDDGLRLDLGQRQVVQGPDLAHHLEVVEQQLATILPELFTDQELLHACHNWIYQALTGWQQRGGRDLLGKVLAACKIFPMVGEADYSLDQLDQLYADSNCLYWCSEAPDYLPSGAPPLLILQTEFQTLLTARFTHLQPCEEVLTPLCRAEENRRQWNIRKSESLRLDLVEKDCVFTCQVGGWHGYIGFSITEVAAKLDVFMDRRWLASVELPANFPKGLVGRLEHSEIKMNKTWSQPDVRDEQWLELVNFLWQQLPAWLTQALSSCAQDNTSQWLTERAYQLLLLHPHAQLLEEVPLISVGSLCLSLYECRKYFGNNLWRDLIFQGWQPRADGFLLLKLLVVESQFQVWKMRLEGYQRGFDQWKSSSVQTIKLAQPEQLICYYTLPEEQGLVGLRSSQEQNVEISGYRDGRYLGRIVTTSMPMEQGGFPEGLVADINHPHLWPDDNWTGLLTEDTGWCEARDWIWQALPGLVGLLLHKTEAVRAVRLLNWLPRSFWPDLKSCGDLLSRLDTSRVSLFQAVMALEHGPPLRVLENAGVIDVLPGFEDVWLISQELAAEIRAIWGPSRLVEVQEEYLSKMMTLEHSASQLELAILPEGQWLIRESWENGEIGLCVKPGPANRCYLRLLRHGHLLLQHVWPLLPVGADDSSRFRLELVIDWAEAPLLTTFSQMWQDSAGRTWLENLLKRIRLFGFQHKAPREFLWERISFEYNFSHDLDDVGQQIAHWPLFDIDEHRWSLEQVLAYLQKEGRLCYVLGEPVGSKLGPLLFVNNRELHWLKLLLGQTRLANLSHLRKSLRQQQQQVEVMPVRELVLPSVDYLVTKGNGDLVWGLQQEANGVSIVRCYRQMQLLEVIEFDWRYQVQACINLDSLQLTQDGRVLRDQVFFQALQRLRTEVESVICEGTPESYRLSMALWSWGVQEMWALNLQQQPLLHDLRGRLFSVTQWVESWSQGHGCLPFLQQEEDWSSQSELLPSGYVALLPAYLVVTASRMMRGMLDYSAGLRQAWQFLHQPEVASLPEASYQWQQGEITIFAEFDWLEQQIVVIWRNREIHRKSRRQWPGYLVRVDWTEHLLGQTWPDWVELGAWLMPYWKYLHNFLQQPEILDNCQERWETLPITAQSGPIPVYYEPTEEDICLLLARRKAEWLQRERSLWYPVQQICELWWHCSVEVEVESANWPLRCVATEEGQRLYLNPAHHWFRGLSTNLIALRVLSWLSAQKPCRKTFLQRNSLLQELGYLE